MKHCRWIILISMFILCFFQISNAQTLTVTRADTSKEYLPGDFVHIIVDAPVDTAQITAVAPDGNILGLVQERRSTVWRGIWQVPINFKSGTYTAKLSAVDVAGNIFEGQTDPFTIRELAVISLVSKSTKEAFAPKALTERITPIRPASAEANLLNVIKKLIAQPMAGPAPELKPAEKAILVSKNFKAGKDSLSEGNFSEAVAYFKVVLYLAPDNKEAGAFLSEASHNLSLQEKAVRQKNLFSTIITIIVSLIIISFIYFILRNILKRAPIAAGEAAPKIPEVKLSDKEKIAAWYKKINWRTNPFGQDIIKSLFADNSILNADGLKSFLKVKIQSVGGSGLLPFTDSAIDEIYTFSKGKPKKAVQICEWAIDQAIEQNLDKISSEHIKGYEKLSLMNILIADDEEIVRTSLEMILRRGGGYQTDYALDGEETLKKIKENTYGAVLLDIEMPKINGYEVLKQARALYPTLPIIFVTGKGQPEKTIESLSNYGLTGYIEKPFTPEKVLDVVASVLKSA